MSEIWQWLDKERQALALMGTYPELQARLKDAIQRGRQMEAKLAQYREAEESESFAIVCKKGVESPAEALLTEFKAQEARIAELEAEVALVRERLGPAGWKMLERLKELETTCAAYRQALEQVDGPCTAGYGDPETCGPGCDQCRARKALSQTAGQAVAERMRLLECVAEAADAYRKEKNPVNFGMLAFHLKCLSLEALKERP